MQSGRLFTHPALARQRFAEMARLPEGALDLAEAALVIALEENPGLEVEHYLTRVAQWSDTVRDRAEGSRDIERLIDEINRLLFREEGFHGEEDGYSDPRSALLNEVLDRHTGVPLSLSILYIEISRRLGLDASGVGLPGRFVVKLSGPFGELVIDPFDGGRVLSARECQQLLDSIFGGGVRLREHHLRSFTRKKILARLLSHLKQAYLACHDIERAAASVDRLLILDDHDAYELRDRASLAMQMHSYREAIECLEKYLMLDPYADDRGRILAEIEYLRAWIEQN